jgi:hypothetical protein
MSSPEIVTLPSEELKDLGHEISRLDLGRLEAATGEPAIQGIHICMSLKLTNGSSNSCFST